MIFWVTYRLRNFTNAIWALHVLALQDPSLRNTGCFFSGLASAIRMSLPLHSLLFGMYAVSTFLLVFLQGSILVLFDIYKWMPSPNPLSVQKKPFLLRTYPPHFGIRLVKLFPQLLSTRSPPPGDSCLSGRAKHPGLFWQPAMGWFVGRCWYGFGFSIC